ncbi:ankyrin-1-like [Mytilus trossulus]|uniref:ankyrin-1-like n=1 Tax=Mytilus trossulus TaxID=6551 RepID=UPI0030067068
MMAPLLEEEENYIRLALLLKGVSPRAVRTFFDKEFSPTYLPSTLNKNYNTLYDLFKKRILNQAQWNLLFPKNGVPNSKTFDVTLMICLIRNLTPVNQPINGFDCLPLPRETTPGPDLARIKWYRNILAHHDSNTMPTGDFNTSWANIADAVSRLGGLPMNQECQELKVKILDKSNQEIMLEIKQSQEEMKELRRTMDIENSTMRENLTDLQDSYSTLHMEHSNTTKHLIDMKDSQRTLQIEHSKVTEILKDPIPWNIRGQITEKLENWNEDDKTFIETDGARRVLRYIKENGCVVVTASSGCGKSSMVRHVALQMQNEGYEILPVSNSKDIIKWYNPIKKILFVVDDFCGTYSLNPMMFDKWKNLMEEIKALVEKKPVKLIMSCRLQVYNDRQMESLSFFQACECNLQSADFCLSKSEKQSIAELYLKTNASEISGLYNMFDCFPLLCQLYSKNSKLNIVDFFTNPFTVYKEEIDKLQTEGAHGKYCALALCVMFNNQLKEEWLTEHVDENIKTVIKNTYEACKVVEGTSRLVLRNELDSLTYTYIIKDGKVYRTIHDKLFDFLAFYFGSEMIYCLINNATSQFISERFLFERKSKNDEFTIIVPTRYQQMYIKRMVDDWSRGEVVDVFCNINMVNLIFRQRFLLHIQSLAISQQKQLASSYDINDKSTPLIQCCFIGDIDLVKWCIQHCISNVNHCRYTDKVSPLYISSAYGYTEVVQMLIHNKADINKCNNEECSPLYIACQNGHTEVVQMLINNKADINKCRDTEVSPLYIACQEGHTEVVKMLINNKADINKCRDTGVSPLYIACLKGHTEVVQMLINNKADINKCRDTLASPLYVACQNGHTEVVQMLINNKADINKCDDEEVSPLYVACQNGHTEVAQMLINNKADINKCRDTGVSPLYIACQEGHTQVVKMLINNKADINKCRDTGVSPLYIACYQGHTEVVKMLINNKADINKCTDTGESPLYVACQNGHTEVVQMLINNKADINKCDDEEVSPLYIACYKGHTEVAQMLINNKADINKCRDTGASPLNVACQNGHTEVVKMLINNKADINKSDNEECSPLYIACQNGHTEVVQMLINNKTDINECDNEECSPLYIACQNGHTEVVQMLINNKADINKCVNEECSPVYIACQNRHTEVVQMLINSKADINKCRDTGASPVYIACYKGHTEVVQMLINNKADINKCDNEECSPLYIACQNGHTEVVQMLINNKADINKCREIGASPLYIACQNGHNNVIQMLINNKADINKCKDTGASPLYIACQEGHTEVVQMFINNKADINKCRDTGESPVYLACQQGHTEVVQMLK